MFLIGEVKRILFISISGFEYLNGISSFVEVKLSVVSFKEILVLNFFRIVDRLVIGVNGGKVDVFDN